MSTYIVKLQMIIKDCLFIGKGKSDRFFSHLNNLEDDSSRKNKIIELIKGKKES